MPNLLAHYGTQGILSRIGLPGADLKWILAGCILPDVPWIVQRAVSTLVPGLFHPYDLRLYVAVQASLVFCLLLAAALALLTERPGAVFGVLGLNALFHLLLDAVQTKWAAGVLLLAPVSWDAWSWGLFWPESATAIVLTAAGVAFLGWVGWRSHSGREVVFEVGRAGRGLGAVVALCAYVGLPLAFTEQAQAAGTHFVDVLRRPAQRPGRYLELDRARWVDRPEGDVVRTFAGEEIPVRGIDWDRSGSVSLRGRFVAPDTLRVTELHPHRSGLRDVASYAGLLAFGLVWWRAARRRREGSSA